MSKHTARHLANAIWHLELAVKSTPEIDPNLEEVRSILAFVQYIAGRFPPPEGSFHGRGRKSHRAKPEPKYDDSYGARRFGLD